jgi:predicted secreted hydrolase
MKRLPIILIALTVLAITATLIFAANAKPSEQPALVIPDSTPPAGFELVTEPMLIEFPAAFDAQLEYQTEWWYYTGNLETADGRHFGYQLTFFRRGLIPPTEEQTRESKWASSQVYFAHFTISDVAANQFYYVEEVGRGAAGIAGAQINPFQVWIENWSVEETGSDTYRLYASHDNLILDLTLEDLKGPILHGDAGYMPSGTNVGDASYYYSQTRLDSTGTIEVDGKSYSVTGLSWMDRQYGTTAILTPEQGGWNWFAFHFSDGSELMLYELRQPDGSPNQFSRGTYIAPDGATIDLPVEDFTIEVRDTWRSPHTGAIYPARWTITVPSLDLTLDVIPYMADQELIVSQRYWEGAVELTGSLNGADISGSGYVEMTGYAPAN